MPDHPSPEQFEAWARQQAYEIERRALLRRLKRLHTQEFLAYLLTFGWVLVLFVLFQLSRIDGGLAGLLTGWVLIGGAYLAWLLRRRQRQTHAQLEALRKAYGIAEETRREE